MVKNYLRKIYDKLHVVDRLELALYSMHHRLLEGHSLPSSGEASDANGLVDGEEAKSPSDVPVADTPPPQQVNAAAAGKNGKLDPA